MEEIWKDIKGYEGLYQVSNLGRVKSLKMVLSGNMPDDIHRKSIKKLINIFIWQEKRKKW